MAGPARPRWKDQVRERSAERLLAREAEGLLRGRVPCYTPPSADMATMQSGAPSSIAAGSLSKDHPAADPGPDRGASARGQSAHPSPLGYAIRRGLGPITRSIGMGRGWSKPQTALKHRRRRRLANRSE